MPTYTQAQLADEINTNPKTLGYAAPKALANAAGDEQIAAILNATYAGAGAVPVYRTDVTASELIGCIVWSEVSAYTAVQVNWINVLLSTGTVDASNSRIRLMFAGIFSGAGSAVTRANMDTVAKITAPTRAEELWGHRAGVSPYDIQKAMGR